MVYAWQADLWCDTCGGEIRARMIADGVEDDGDSGTLPQSGAAGESDGVRFCAAGSECQSPDAVVLATGDVIGEDVTDGLTSEGEESVREYLSDTSRTDPYSVALREYYSAHYPECVPAAPDDDGDDDSEEGASR